MPAGSRRTSELKEYLMSHEAATHQPSPELFFQSISAYQRTEALKAAIELDLFTAIGEGAQTADVLARRCEASERGMRILCDYLVVAGFLTKERSSYRLTPDTAVFLDRRSPAYMGSAAAFMTSAMLVDAFRDLTGAVRKGGTMIGEEGSVAPENPVWVEFARSMASMMALPAELIAGRLNARAGDTWKVLDIAAGHGLFGIALAKQNPNAQIVALDWPNVLAVARENAEAAGVAGRFRTLPGNAFEVEFGSGYDLVLLTNFLHHFDPPTCEALLRKVHASLAPGGRAVTLEFVPNADRVTPPESAGFSLVMLATTPRGDAYTFPELERMFRTAGFSASEIHPLPPSIQQLVISHR
jgi:ubiquinone/menaquinone biosynthesis C-methylase UbiE